MNQKRLKPRRVYTKKSMKLMWRVRGVILVLFFPLWFPLYALTFIGMWMEEVLNRPNRELLLDCRNGKYSFEEALEMVEMYDNQLKAAYEKSPLPATPNYKRINELLIEINREGLSL